MVARHPSQEREGQPKPGRPARGAGGRGRHQGGGMTPAGRRLTAALREVLADIRGEKPLPAAVPARLDVKAVRRKTGLTRRA